MHWPGLDSNFVILRFDQQTVNDLIYVEGLVGNIYLEGIDDLERYRRIFSRLQSMALDPKGSVAMAMRIAATYEELASSLEIYKDNDHPGSRDDSRSEMEMACFPGG